MNISVNPTITPNLKQNNLIKTHNNVQFTGALGDKFVRDVTLMADVKPESIMKELKGTFGLKSEKVYDVLESFIEALRKVTLQERKLEGDLRKANDRIAKFPDEKYNAVYEAETKLRTSFRDVISGKEKEIEAAKTETKEVQAVLEKYKPVVNVKSVEEVASIMPDKALEIINEMVEHKAAANKSMFDFLMTGQGQEEALAQIERNNILRKARSEGIFDIPSIKETSTDICNKNHIYVGSDDQYFTTTLIEKALMSDPKGEYLSSRTVREQVKKNAMAILTPMADERYNNTGIEAIEKELDKTLDYATKFNENFKKGLEKIKARYKDSKDFKMTINKVENDIDASYVTVKYTETYNSGSTQPISYEETFNRIANYGSSNW